MRYRVLHPFRDKYHPEDIFYPQEIIVVEDKERLEDLMGLELLGYCSDQVSEPKRLKNKPASKGFSELTVKEIKALLEEKEIEYDEKMKKTELLELLEGAQ